MALIYHLAADASAGINRRCTDYASAIWAFKEVLKQAGWVVTYSGTGTAGTFGTSDLLTSAAMLTTNYVWFVIRDPSGAGGRSFLLQRSTTDTSWRVYYSQSAEFTGSGFGAVSATVPPSAADQQQILGTGGGYTTFFQVSPASVFSIYAIAQNAADAGVYGFWFFMPPSSSSSAGLFALEPVKDGNPADPDPCVVMAPMNLNNQPTSSSTSINGTTSAWYGKGTGSEVYRGCNAGEMYRPSMGSTNLVPPSSQGLVTTRSGKEYEIDICWGWNNTQYPGSGGFKGTGRYVRWKATGFREWPFLYDADQPEPRFVLGNITLPWPAGEPILYA